MTLCRPCLPSAPYPAEEHSHAAPPIFIELRVIYGRAEDLDIAGGLSYPEPPLASVTLGESCLLVTPFNITLGVSSVCKIYSPQGLQGWLTLCLYRSLAEQLAVFFARECINNANRQIKKQSPALPFHQQVGIKSPAFLMAKALKFIVHESTWPPETGCSFLFCSWLIGQNPPLMFPPLGKLGV